jgi:hypothetical protein
MGKSDGWIGHTMRLQDRLTPALRHRFQVTMDSADGGPVAPQGIDWKLTQHSLFPGINCQHIGDGATSPGRNQTFLGAE